MKTVAIVGVGLIGGSFALALRKAGFEGRIVGVSSPDAIREARRIGAVDESMALPDAAACADLIYLSQPVGRILETLELIDAWAQPGALITDAGSTKAAIVTTAERTIRRARFLGGHPLAGKERRGASSADADLFAGRTYVLTPRPSAASPAEFISWLERIGAIVMTMTAVEHDRVVALTSHLPQLAATALAATIGAHLPSPEHLAVSGSGLADSTRLALSSYEIWRDILATNPDEINKALGAYIDRLTSIRGRLRTCDLEEDFRAGADLSARLRK